MSWVKNLWHRLFREDTEEVGTEIQWEEEPVQKSDKTPFRFPLIPDEDKEVFFESDSIVEKTKAPVANDEFEKPAAKLAEPVRRNFEPVRPINTRRFEPTRVPSPVHGFNERKPILKEELPVQREKAIIEKPVSVTDLENTKEKHAEAKEEIYEVKEEVMEMT